MLFTLAGPASAMAQDAAIGKDSLQNLLENVENIQEQGRVDEAREKAEYALAQSRLLRDPVLISKAYWLLAEVHFVGRNLKESQRFAEKALEYCDVAYDTLTCLSAHSLMGSILTYQSNFHESIKAYEQALKICEQAGFKDRAVRIRFNMATPLADMGDYEGALNIMLECIKFFEGKKDEEERLALVYNNLGLLYLNKLGNAEKALQNFIKAVEIYSRYDNPYNLARATNNLGLAYAGVGNFEMARQHLENVVAIRKALNDQGNLAFTYHGLGDLLLKMGEFDQALEYLHSCLEISEANGIGEGKYYAGLGLGMAYDSTGNRQQAHTYLQQAYDYALESGILKFLVSSLEHLYRHYKQHNQVNSALSSLEKLYHYRQEHDSLLHDNNLNRLEMRYTSELTAKENELLRINQAKQEKTIYKEKAAKAVLYVVTLLMLLLLIFLSVSYQQRNVMLKKLRAHQQKLEEQKQELNEVNESKNRLFSVISHDLRSPLSSVIGYLEILRLQMNDDDPMAPLLTDLQHETRNTLDTLEDLLAWSRIQMSGISLQPKSFDLNALVRSVTNVFAANARHKNIKLSFTPETETCMVYADEQQIKTVLRNLLSNALKFSPEHSEVRLATTSGSHTCTLKVMDQGKGISTEELKKIQNPEEQYTSAGTQNEQGTGLGLLLTYQYLQINNGSLEFRQNEPNGTVALVNLRAGNQLSQIA